MINNYKTIIFDCDGVILNSNRVKREAYFKVALSHYGEEHATSLVQYLSKNTGNPREHFFNHFLKNIVSKSISKKEVNQLVSEVSLEIYQGLMECEISQGLFDLRKNSPNLKWLVVSGGVEKELRDVFSKRSLFDLFDGGIYGGPKTKDEILRFLIQENNLEPPILYLGDSKFDFEAASRINIDFIFVSEWSDFKEWRNFCKKNNILTITSLAELK